MMKRVSVSLLLFGLMLSYSISPIVAQSVVEEIESLQVSFWPDFDQPSVLVLLTGQLPASVTLPAEVEIPIPAGAQINAVAQIDDIGLVSVEYEESEDSVAFSPSSPRFRVEYYVPYERDGSVRTYDFEWLSDLTVTELAAEIQQPANATSLQSDPEAVEVFTSPSDGLVYHRLAPATVPAGVPLRLSFSYEMVGDSLTSSPPTSADQAAVQPVPAAQPAATTAANNNWLLLGGGLALLALAVAGTWFVAKRSTTRKNSRLQKPKPKSRTATARNVTVYCHVCGQPATGEDRFCRHCGTELKRS